MLKELYDELEAKYIQHNMIDIPALLALLKSYFPAEVAAPEPKPVATDEVPANDATPPAEVPVPEEVPSNG